MEQRPCRSSNAQITGLMPGIGATAAKFPAIGTDSSPPNPGQSGAGRTAGLLPSLQPRIGGIRPLALSAGWQRGCSSTGHWLNGRRMGGPS